MEEGGREGRWLQPGTSPMQIRRPTKRWVDWRSRGLCVGAGLAARRRWSDDGATTERRKNKIAGRVLYCSRQTERAAAAAIAPVDAYGDGRSRVALWPMATEGCRDRRRPLRYHTKPGQRTPWHRWSLDFLCALCGERVGGKKYGVWRRVVPKLEMIER